MTLIFLFGLLFWNFYKRHKINQPISSWFKVSFDDSLVHIFVSPPFESCWERSFTWCSITKVCYQFENFGISDGIYIFTGASKDSFVIPVEANGGGRFLKEIFDRGLFCEEKFIEFSQGGVGQRICS